MNRPEEIKGRIDNIHEIANIVSTLQALATAHVIEVRAHLKSIRAHETHIANALSTALSLMSVEPAPALKGAGVVVVVGASQGFCGGYSDRLADAALAEAAKGRKLMVAGARTAGALTERGIEPIWYEDMAPHARDVPRLATRLVDALFGHLVEAPGAPVTVLFADPASAPALIRRSVLPFDFTRFSRAPGKNVLITLPVPRLVAALVEEYVFAEFCEALMLGFAAENGARAEAMARAKSNVSRIATDLKAEFQRARQEQMTTEIIELSAAAATNPRWFGDA